MDYFPFGFSALVEEHALGSYVYTVVWLPDEIAAQLPLGEHPRLRISGEINEHPFTGAWQPSRGRWYLMLGKPLLRATGLAIDAWAEVRFRIEEQDAVDVPPLLLRALAANATASARWAALTPGKQRALSHRLLSAKSAPTAARRIAEIIDWLVAGETDLRRLGKL